MLGTADTAFYIISQFYGIDKLINNLTKFIIIYL